MAQLLKDLLYYGVVTVQKIKNHDSTTKIPTIKLHVVKKTANETTKKL